MPLEAELTVVVDFIVKRHIQDLYLWSKEYLLKDISPHSLHGITAKLNCLSIYVLSRTGEYRLHDIF